MVAKVKRPLLAAVLALSVLGALVLLALPASAAPLAHLEAKLTGEKEVPGPGDPNGIGKANIKVFRAKVCYTLTARRIEPATAAHIHEGRRGVAGPPVVTLKPPTDGSSSGCEEITRSLSRALREHPGQYYVNVHNEPYPDGAIRGQLERN
jgi:CHRD domain-containing protein